MSIPYDFKKLPRTSGSSDEPARLYPQAVKSKTLTFSELADEIEEAASFTHADVEGVMRAIVKVAAMHLNAGEHIELEGLGTLSLGIACRRDDTGHAPVITSPSQVKPRDLYVSRVNFDAKPEFMKTLTGPFVRAKDGFPSNRGKDVPTPDERRALLVEHLSERPYITVSAYMQLTRLTRHEASVELKTLVAEGLLSRSGQVPHVVYVRKQP